jgi:hypothetical protein
MKKIVIIAAVCLLLGSVLSSCNNEVCPAYTQAETEQSAEIA